MSGAGSRSAANGAIRRMPCIACWIASASSARRSGPGLRPRWPPPRLPNPAPARVTLIAEALRPAATTDAWLAHRADRRRGLRRPHAPRRGEPARRSRGASRCACARPWRRPAAPRRSSRPTARWRGASRPSCGAGTSRSTIRRARRSPRRRPAVFCVSLPPPRSSAWRRWPCSRRSSTRWPRAARHPAPSATRCAGWSARCCAGRGRRRMSPACARR